ncbi:MAG: VapC toxin family PIN domain ribonuclease [Burkholderiaceae bacterium]
MTETACLLQAWLGTDAASAFVAEVAERSIFVCDLPKESVSRMARLMVQYGKLPMDLADASLLLLAQHSNHGRVLTTDGRDFGAYRWKSRRPFVDLMADS